MAEPISRAEGDRLLAAAGFAVHEDASEPQRLTLVPASTVRPEKVRWVWRDRIPLGALTVAAGPPGLGKSTNTTEISARVSRGQLVGDLLGVPSNVIVVSAEDHRASVILPRLLAAGADLGRIFFLDAGDDGFAVPDGLLDLARVAGEIRARLVILDPFSAFLTGRVNSWRDHDVRRALAPLARFAEDLDLAVVTVSHFTKAQTADLLSKVGGSVAFTAAPRSVLAFAQDPADPDGPTRVLVHAKSNVGAYAVTLRYRVDSRTVDGEDGAIATSGIAWLGEAPEIGPNDLLSGESGEERTEREEAVALLRGILADGPRRSRDVYQDAQHAGIAERTLKRAKKDAGVIAQKEGMNGPWWWRLPTSEGGQEEGHMSESGPLRARPAERGQVNAEGGHQIAIDPLRGGADPLRPTGPSTVASVASVSGREGELLCPTVEELLDVARALGWPAVAINGTRLAASEAAWRSWTAKASPGRRLAAAAALSDLEGVTPDAAEGTVEGALAQLRAEFGEIRLAPPAGEEP